MAYANLVNQAVTSKNELFTRFRDFLCKRNGTYDYSTTGIGWTLIDSSYATDEDNCANGDWFVIYSPGEGGKDDLYIRIDWSSNYIRTHGYQSWDAVTHTGSTNRYSVGSTWTMSDSVAPTNLWVYGDLDSILGAHKVSSVDYRNCYFGKCDTGYEDITGEIATCNTILTAGSDVSIVVDSAPAEWAVDREIFIRTTHNDAMGTVKVEKIKIKTISGNTITADLSNSYTTGSCLSDHIGYACQSATAFGTGNAIIDSNNLIPGATTVNNLSFTTSYFDPEGYESRYVLYELFLTCAGGLLGKMKNLKYSTTFGISPLLTYEDVLQELDGTQWRCFKFYNSRYIAVKEV